MSSYFAPNFDEEAIELEAQAILSKRRIISAPNADRVDSLDDSSWIKQSFMVDPKVEISELDLHLRVYSSAEFKFEDSSIGGSHEVNPRPQFTRYADARVPGKLIERSPTKINSATGDHGMGHYYSEAIHDNSQVIHLRFGVPQFNSLTTFFTGFFNYKAATVARTGRADTSIFYDIGQATALVSLFAAWPLLLFTVAVSTAGQFVRFLRDKPSTSFYSFKPTMPIYWYSVNTMVNQIGVYKGFYPSAMEQAVGNDIGQYQNLDQNSLNRLHEILPDIFSYGTFFDGAPPKGGIDVYAVANRAKRLKNRLDYVLAEMLAKGEAENLKGFVTEYQSRVKNEIQKANQKKGSLESTLNLWFNSAYGEIAEKGSENFSSEAQAVKIDANGRGVKEPNIAEIAQAEFDDGSEFASFRVDATGAISESFSNSFVENDLASKFNSISSSGKAAYFSFAGYNITEALQPVQEAFKQFAGGALDTIQMSGLLALGGSAFVDIPKNWENSSVNFPKANYTMTLISPYGHPIAQMTNIYIPLCMILAGVLPLQTGKRSYTSPFICQIYDKGRQQSRLGMIDSVTVQRGTSNLSFNKQGNAMAVEVSFSIADLSSVMAMPIVERTLLEEALNVFDSMFDDENVFSDYMNILASTSLQQQFYVSNKLKIRYQQKLRSLQRIFSPSRSMQIVHNFPPVGWLDIFFQGTDRI